MKVSVNVNFDNYSNQLLQNYLDDQETVEDWHGDKVNINETLCYKDEYFLIEDASDFLDHLNLSDLEILEELGAE